LRKKKKISKSFISFLLASILIWFLITLSKDYSISLTFPVRYKNIPQDKIVEKKPTQKIDFLVQASGFNILRARFANKEIVLNADRLTKKRAKSYYFLSRNQLGRIKKQLPSGIQLQEIVQDTFYLNLGSLASKKLPLIANLDIDYHVGYEISGLLNIKPDSVVVSGPEDQIKNIKGVNLEVLKLKDVKADFSKKVKVVTPSNIKTIKVSTNVATLSAKVERFTEGTLEIPFKIINLPEGGELTTLNKTVEVIYIVGLSNFNKIDKNFFEVICDYQTAKDNNLNYLIPKTIVKSNLVKSFKVIPNKIDFLIQK